MTVDLDTASPCCSAEAQADCCEPSEKAECCTPESSSCGCSAGNFDAEEIRAAVRSRYGAAPTSVSGGAEPLRRQAQGAGGGGPRPQARGRFAVSDVIADEDMDEATCADMAHGRAVSPGH